MVVNDGKTKHGGQAGRPRKGVVPLESLVDGCIGSALKARGFSTSAITLHWDEIVGAQLAAWSEPVQIKWPPRPADGSRQDKPMGATLIVRVESAFALDMQHRAPQLLERVNSYLGWRCVARLQLQQGPVRKAEAPPVREKAVLTPEKSRQLDATLADMDDGPVRQALLRLGVQVLGQRR